MINARSQYDERPNMASDISFEGDKGVTKQADAKDTDINMLFKRFEKTGQLPDLILRDGRYGDFSAVPDYQEAVNIVRMAEEQFANLDVSLRNRFENDPVKFLSFATDANNLDEMEKMGLLSEEAKADRRSKREAAMKAEQAVAEAAKAAARAEAEAALVAKIKAELGK